MTDERTLREAQNELREVIMGGGSARCPCCTQNVKVYKRQVHASIAWSLIMLYRRAGLRNWAHMQTVLKQAADGQGITKGRDEAMAQYWGLLEPGAERREDGGKAGLWRVTEQGALFVQGIEVIHQYAHVYDGKLLRHSGPVVSIRDCLGKVFDYDELMSM